MLQNLGLEGITNMLQGQTQVALKNWIEHEVEATICGILLYENLFVEHYRKK